MTGADTHARLDSASPAVGSTVSASPSQVTLHFTEALEPKFSGAMVHNSSGARVDTGSSASGTTMRVGVKSLGPGAYTVTWHALSVDTPKHKAASRSTSENDPRPRVDDTLIFWRALHFMAAIQMLGVLLFGAYVLRGRKRSVLMGRRLGLIFWVSLALAFVSGTAWLLAVAASIDDVSWTAAIADGTAATVLTDTQFGRAWLVRVIAVFLLGIVAALAKKENLAVLILQLALAAVFVGGLAFAGHAASTPGVQGDIHLAGDILHLFAVSAWLGGLLPYAFYLWSCEGENAGESSRRHRGGNALVFQYWPCRRSDHRGDGLINALNLVGSVELLTHTDYGRLLSVKVAIFLVMVIIAAVNRFGLVPRLAERGAVATLRRNALIEAIFGLLILCIVAALGTMPPALLDHAGMHH